MDMDATPAPPVLSTVAELNHTLKSTPVPAHLLRKLTFVEQRLVEKSRVLGRLIHIKFLYGSHPSTEEYFTKSRQVYREIDSQVHLRQYCTMFGEINSDAGSPFGPARVQRFLDLGCSPGGFSEWLLANNPRGTGIGVTLADADARWAMNIRNTYLESPRYELRFADVTRLAMAEVSSVLPAPGDAAADVPPQSQSAFGAQSFDLIIAGAFPTLTGGVRIAYRAQLVMTQIYFTLRHLAFGGNAVVVINTKTYPWIIEVVGILRQCFASIQTGKGRSLHATRSSCYLVCKDFTATQADRERLTKDVISALSLLQMLLDRPTTGPGGEKALGGEELEDEDDGDDDAEPPAEPAKDRHPLYKPCLRLFPKRSYGQLFEEEHQYFLALFEPTWSGQYQALYRALNKAIRAAEKGKSPQWTAQNGQHRSRAVSEHPLPEAQGTSHVVQNNTAAVYRPPSLRTSAFPSAQK